MTTTLFRKTAPMLALLGLGLSACQPDLEKDFEPSSGTADFTTYVAVGNSLTSGFSDGGLYLEGQQNSFPSILAQQFAKAGGGEFQQPLFPDNGFNGGGYLKITGFNNGSPTIGPETANLAIVGLGADGKTPLLSRYDGTGNQNLGVPGIRVADVLTPGYGLNNPLGFNQYFERLLPASSPSTYLQYVQERVATLKPTFFTNWLGNNDVLGYASSGGTAAPLTEVGEFTTKYDQVLDALTTSGAKGLVVTIPNVSNVPLFTTVPTAGVIAQVQGTPIPPELVPVIGASLGLPAGAPLPEGTRFGLYIKTSDAKKPIREATAKDLILLPASSFINSAPVSPNLFPGGIGLVIPGASAEVAGALAAISNALPNNLVLDEAEAKNVATRTGELNAAIKASASARGLAVFDANAFFATVASNGIVANGVNNTAGFVSGNLFSLDGVHPTPRGYAIIANEMIKVINSTYGAKVPTVNPNDYRGVKFP
ncbi:SGNH/GDSL hydrolase family protein [Hymenobacter aerophilus]|uniref:SGNH/GDSL hydrolase family protein n=1 Tax=Hymenobacter aerophilus TaxID=119644 RepID=UPI00036FF78F|nr:SGNH/GDSL hydrolase family protein [Hymenobacter aerophilus]